MENNEKKINKQNNHGCLWAFGAFGLILIVALIGFQMNDKGSTPFFGLEDQRTELEGDLDYIVYSHKNKDERKIVDRWTDKVILNDLSWICQNDGDSLIAYAQKNRRGYLNLRSRKATLLDEKYVKIYLFREGRALAESLDSLYVLNTQMKEVARYKKTDERDTEVNYYHKGHLPMIGENGKLGLVDTCGIWAIDPQYDKVSWALDEFWLGITNPVMVDEVTGKETAPHRIMMDSHLRTVMEGDWTYLMVTKDGYVTVADQNHWQWHYDLSGNVIDDFVCKDIQQMTFQAGGLGLNLTLANHVILMDPWWNPAIEQQAIDRAYRIGQQRDVSVIHLISANTIEEKNVRLQKTKKDMASALLSGEEMTKGITYDEILELVQS